jgi:ABC-2 type transport system permease protein
VTTAVRAEERKLTTTQVLIWMVVLSVGLSLVFSGLFSGFADSGDNSPESRPLELILNFTSGFPFLVASILGVIGITGEYRHLTVTPTFLSVPRRGTVVAAKLWRRWLRWPLPGSARAGSPSISGRAAPSASSSG